MEIDEDMRAASSLVSVSWPSVAASGRRLPGMRRCPGRALSAMKMTCRCIAEQRESRDTLESPILVVRPEVMVLVLIIEA